MTQVSHCRRLKLKFTILLFSVIEMWPITLIEQVYGTVSSFPYTETCDVTGTQTGGGI